MVTKLDQDWQYPTVMVAAATGHTDFIYALAQLTGWSMERANAAFDEAVRRGMINRKPEALTRPAKPKDQAS
jgi:hypothetical protein